MIKVIVDRMNIPILIVAFLLAFLPALLWLFFYYHKDYKDPKPKAVLAQTFFMGALAAFPFLILKAFLAKFSGLPVFLTGASSVILFAVMEELAKLSASIFVVMKNRLEFNQIIDGVVYAVTAALGFAFIENKIYFYEFLSQGGDQITTVFLFRSFGTMLAHTLFSAMAGLIWAYAYFSKQISPFQKKHLIAFELKDFINKEILTLHIIRNNILKARPSRRGGHEKKILVLEGIIVASLMHAAFNLMTTFELFGKTLTFLIVPGLMSWLLYASYLFTKRLNTKILKVV